jgi:hypothetical protein
MTSSSGTAALRSSRLLQRRTRTRSWSCRALDLSIWKRLRTLRTVSGACGVCKASLTCVFSHCHCLEWSWRSRGKASDLGQSIIIDNECRPATRLRTSCTEWSRLPVAFPTQLAARSRTTRLKLSTRRRDRPFPTPRGSSLTTGNHSLALCGPVAHPLRQVV